MPYKNADEATVFWKQHRQKNIEQYRKYDREWKQKRRVELRDILISRLGGVCVGCGNHNRQILHFDHISGGGCAENSGNKRDSLGKYTKLFKDSSELIKLQLLCPNCNWLKRTSSNECFTPYSLTPKGIARRLRRKKLRLNALAHLGGRCKVCEIDDERLLQIDHVNGNGAFETLQRGPTRDQDKFYKKVSATFTETNMYQLLCVNHNWEKRVLSNENPPRL